MYIRRGEYHLLSFSLENLLHGARMGLEPMHYAHTSWTVAGQILNSAQLKVAGGSLAVSLIELVCLSLSSRMAVLKPLLSDEPWIKCRGASLRVRCARDS